MRPTADECAHELLEVIPEVMQVIRAEIRQQRGRELSILQLRTLAFLARNPGATLSAVAEHVGLTLSSMSTQVTKLVQRQLIQREEAPQDRRYLTLVLTASGQALLEAARHGAQTNLASRCEKLSPTEQATVIQAMQMLRMRLSTPATSETE